MIEFARMALGTDDANSEFNVFTEHPVIDLMPDQTDVTDKGGTMRLGLYPARLEDGSKVRAAYGTEIAYERHRHRFEVNNAYRERLSAAGMWFSGVSPDDRLVEYIELRDHPWFVATQAHPELKSRRIGRTRSSASSSGPPPSGSFPNPGRDGSRRAPPPLPSIEDEHPLPTPIPHRRPCASRRPSSTRRSRPPSGARSSSGAASASRSRRSRRASRGPTAAMNATASMQAGSMRWRH